MVAVLRAEVVSPSDVNTEMLDGYGLVGFGSGIALGKHCAQILKLSTGVQFFHKNAFAAGGWTASQVLPPCFETPIEGEWMDYCWLVLVSCI